MDNINLMKQNLRDNNLNKRLFKNKLRYCLLYLRGEIVYNKPE